METIFIKTENNKTNEPQKFVLNVSQRLPLRSPNKQVALQNLSIYYTWKNIRKQYKNNKSIIIALQREMMNLNYQMVLVLFQIFKIILNAS